MKRWCLFVDKKYEKEPFEKKINDKSLLEKGINLKEAINPNLIYLKE